MKKVMWLMLIVWLAGVGLAGAQNILWVSNCWTETEPHDQGFIDLLEADGYTVTRWTDQAPFSQDPMDIDAITQALANTYDLVIVGRHGGSGYADNDAERALWNGITAPMIAQGAYNTRANRWGLLNSNTVSNTTASLKAVIPSDPVFAGVTLDEDDSCSFITNDTALVETLDPGNGTLVAVRNVDGGERPFIVRFDTGVEYFNGSGQIAGGPRMILHSGSSGGPGDGTYNLTAAGQLIFLNAVYEMSGATFNRLPLVAAGTDHITHIGDSVQLDGTAYDPEGAVTITWSRIAGPGNVDFSDTSATNPTVSFDAKGTHTLQLSVDDGANPAVTDTITVYVKDHADDALIAHWDFESLPEPNELLDIENTFDGIYFEIDGDGDPNVVAGHINGSLVAADFLGNSYWEILSPEAGEPNFTSASLGMTISAWTKIEDSPDTGFPVLLGHGTDGWRFQVNSNRWNFACQPTGIDVFVTSRPAFDPYWHHVVGVYDGANAQVRMYIDGALELAEDVPAGALLLSGDQPLQLGNRQDGPRLWPGQCDDLKVYNYALNEAEIAALTAEGDVVPFITAGENQTVPYTGDPVAMDATRIVDDGVPNPVSLTWSVVTVPLGANAEDVIFSDVNAEDPDVTFPTVAGTYFLSLTADDGEVQVTAEVNVVIEIPTCADVLAEGLGFAVDVSGPEGIPDCRVDFYDLAEVAVNWLRCNDPQDGTCEWPY